MRVSSRPWSVPCLHNDGDQWWLPFHAEGFVGGVLVRCTMVGWLRTSCSRIGEAPMRVSASTRSRCLTKTYHDYSQPRSLEYDMNFTS